LKVWGGGVEVLEVGYRFKISVFDFGVQNFGLRIWGF